MTAKIVVSAALMAALLSQTNLGGLAREVAHASPSWLLVALAVYLASLGVATWRWHLLLGAQGTRFGGRTLFCSYLVALFFNNFLPSNIGGDVVRIGDTAARLGSKTLAATIVLIDRGIGLIGLVLVAALGATLAAGGTGAPVPVWPSWLWAGLLAAMILSAPAVIAPAGVGRLLQPLTVFHPEWVGDRITRVTDTLGRFRARPSALGACFAGAVVVQAVLVLYYAAVAHALGIPISLWHLAVLVPVSFLVQMLPVSMNGFGVREATFSFYFGRLGLPIESAMALSLLATGLTMFLSLLGAGVYVARGRTRKPPAASP
ncbi:MAG TPA: lysylphosphatidylglycerol synthase transmembrane domain-containing protein [Vicinamibacterales bacterium]|nr:lysylphosphatidylglycerol synthase transmembrane domain-containing protein [Vicinamibacterales bacterium]